MKQRQGEDSISLNKYIADTGFCSRREADKYIDQGRVTINDNVAIPGNRVQAGDVVEVDGEPIGKKKATIYLAYHKPRGITSTTDQRDKTNIIDVIAHAQRIFPIGRLDKEAIPPLGGSMQKATKSRTLKSSSSMGRK
jgi:23S rRNA pseudouridine2604 synthase